MLHSCIKMNHVRWKLISWGTVAFLNLAGFYESYFLLCIITFCWSFSISNLVNTPLSSCNHRDVFDVHSVYKHSCSMSQLHNVPVFNKRLPSVMQWPDYWTHLIYPQWLNVSHATLLTHITPPPPPSHTLMYSFCVVFLVLAEHIKITWVSPCACPQTNADAVTC